MQSFANSLSAREPCADVRRLCLEINHAWMLGHAKFFAELNGLSFNSVLPTAVMYYQLPAT